jgi:cholesterol oxidase
LQIRSGIDNRGVRDPRRGLDGFDGTRKTYWIQDGGTPNVLNKYFEAVLNRARHQPSESHLLEGFNMKSLLRHLTLFAANFDVFKRIMPWFAQGVDAGDGELFLTAGSLDLNWDIHPSVPLFETIEKRYLTVSEATHGHTFPLPTWTLSHELLTPHPLGGCNMAATPNGGVVNPKAKSLGSRISTLRTEPSFPDHWE